MERNQDQNSDSRIPEESSSKAMDSKKDVERSNDPKTDQDFPGYPHYPAKEDMMDQRTDQHRVDVDVENLPSGHNASGVSQRFVTANEGDRGNHRGEPAREDREAEDSLDLLDGENDEIGRRQNVSNEELDRNSSGTEPLDEIERMDDKPSSSR